MPIVESPITPEQKVLMDKMVGGIPPKRSKPSVDSPKIPIPEEVDRTPLSESKSANLRSAKQTPPKMAAPEIPKKPETIQPLFDKGELATGTKSLFGAPSQERLVKAKPKAKPVAAPKSVIEGIEDELSDHSKNRKSLPGQKHIGGEEAIHRSDVTKQNIESIAKQHGVKPEIAERAMNDAHALQSQHWEHENSVIKDAMKRLGKGRNAGFLSLHENQHGRDYSTIKGFDEIAQEIALAHPHMGWDPHDTGTSQKLWDLIRKTRTPQPQLHDESVAKQASQMLKPTLKKPAKKEESLFNPAEFDGPDEFAMDPKPEAKPEATAQSGIKPVGFVNHGHNDKSIKNIQSRIDAHKDKLSKVDADIAHIEKSGSKAGLDSLKKAKEKFLDDINQEEKRLYHVQREIHANTAPHPLEKYASSARIDAEQRAENGVKGALSESQIAKNMHTHMEEEIAKRHPELSSEAKAEAAKLASYSLARTPMDGIDSAVKKAVDSVTPKAEPAKVAAQPVPTSPARPAPVIPDGARLVKNKPTALQIAEESIKNKENIGTVMERHGITGKDRVSMRKEVIKNYEDLVAKSAPKIESPSPARQKAMDAQGVKQSAEDRVNDLKEAIKANGGHAANSADNIDKIRNSMHDKYRDNMPTHKEIHGMMDQMRNESPIRMESAAPKPTPEVRLEKKAKQVSFLGSPEAESITHKFANSAMDQQAKNGFVSGGSEFTGKYTNLSDKDKMLVIKGLASRGLVSQSMARKRTPPVGREVFDEVSAMSKKIVENHKMVATNRHIPVQESTDYSRAIDGPPPSTEPAPSQINKLFKRSGPEQPAGEPIVAHPQVSVAKPSVPSPSKELWSAEKQPWRADQHAGQKVVKDLGDGYSMTTQMDNSGKVVPVTFHDGREFIHVTKNGKGAWFYRSFMGTGNKTAGQWYPTGGLAKDKAGGGWIIKGDPASDKGYGRPELAKMSDHLNKVLPHDDAKVNEMLKELHGGKMPDVVTNSKPHIFEVDSLSDKPSILNSWKDNVLNKIWGRRPSASGPPSNESFSDRTNKMFYKSGPEQPKSGELVSHPQKPADLISLIRQVESGADNGALISSRELRKHAGMGKEEFDNHVLKLAAEGKLMLHRHDYPAGLTEKELAELVKGKEGQHFVGMALSRNQPEPEKYTTRLIPKAGKPTTAMSADARKVNESSINGYITNRGPKDAERLLSKYLSDNEMPPLNEASLVYLRTLAKLHKPGQTQLDVKHIEKARSAVKEFLDKK